MAKKQLIESDRYRVVSLSQTMLELEDEPRPSKRMAKKCFDVVRSNRRVGVERNDSIGFRRQDFAQSKLHPHLPRLPHAEAQTRLRGVENMDREGAGQGDGLEFTKMGGAFGALDAGSIRGMIENDNYATLPGRNSRPPEARFE